MTLSLAQLTGQDTQFLVPINARPNAPCLHPEVLEHLEALRHSAHQAGFTLTIASAHRPFDRQLAIWNGKYRGEKPVLDDHGQPIDIHTLTDNERVRAILRWSALPGTSRHHWGTDLDVFDQQALAPGESLALTQAEYDHGPQARFATWLHAHAPRYGFFFPYAQVQGGVAREPWHISHIATSQPLLNALTLDGLHHVIAQAPILGQQAILEQLDWIYSTYVTNICEVHSWNG